LNSAEAGQIIQKIQAYSFIGYFSCAGRQSLVDYQFTKQHTTMTKVLITGQVEDSAKWEAGFRTHADLFRSMSITKLEFATTANNEVAICGETTDLNKYMEIFNSPATAEAMAFDGVKRDTVKVFVLDKEVKI
jgi:uncharacterized CHY-type Zn-finger protein